MTLHIAAYRDVGLAVRGGMRVSVRIGRDGWLVGPCSLDPEVHLRLRSGFWSFWPSSKSERAAFTASYRRILKALAAEEPVVVWSSPGWSERVAAWASCYFRLHYRPTQPDLTLVVVGEIVPGRVPLRFEEGYVHVNPELARRAWETARPLSLSEVRDKARLWKKLTAPSPILSGKPLRETRANKELLELGAYQAGFFPRQSARGLSLSILDALLLGCVNRTPSSPAAIIGRAGEEGELLQWMHLTGDIILFHRLTQWAERGALHAKPYTAPNGWQTAKYTLSAHGRSLLRDGLTSLDQAPPLPIWGVTAYDPNNPWVVVEEPGRRPHLRRLE